MAKIATPNLVSALKTADFFSRPFKVLLFNDKVTLDLNHNSRKFLLMSLETPEKLFSNNELNCKPSLLDLSYSVTTLEDSWQNFPIRVFFLIHKID